MSSTKITEFDLDPNMDMAHESTAQEILEKMNQGVTANVIKSIQSGSASKNNNTGYVGVTISPVDMNKSILLVYGFETTNNYFCAGGGYFESNTKINVGFRSNSATIYWTVIEFN